MSIIPQIFMDSTVVVGVPDKQSTIWIATGFLVGRYEGVGPDGLPKYTTYFITNKHVVNGQRALKLQFNSNQGTIVFDLDLIVKRKKQYSGHPNPAVDIVAFSVNINEALKNGVVARFFELNNHSLTKKQMKDTGVCEGSIVYVLGFPVGIATDLVDDIVKAPVCRLGCVSKIEHMYHNNDQLCYIIDSQVFPGNSGGPVVNRPEIVAINGTPYNDKANLIGIVSSYLPYSENLISLQTNRVRMRNEENSGLTIVFPVDYINEVVEIERTRAIGLKPDEKFQGIK